MKEKFQLLDQFKAYVGRNFPQLHSIIIDDAVEQFKQKLRLDANEIAKDEKSIVQGDWPPVQIAQWQAIEVPPMPSVEQIDEAIMYMRAGMIGIEKKPAALDFLYNLRKSLRK